MSGVGPIPTLTPDMVDRFVDWSRGAERVVIGTHLNPDGDAIGSALGVSLWLSALGVANDVLCHHSPPSYLEFLPAVDRIRLESPDKEFDLGIVVDLDSLDRLGRHQDTFRSLSRLIIVDHHVPHESPGDLRIVDTRAPATACILTDLLDQAGPGLTPEIAECLLTGIVTDTGCFRYPNATAESLHQAARLIEAGANLSRVTHHVYSSRSEAAVRLLGAALNQLQHTEQGAIAWATLKPELYLTLGATDEHTEGIVNEILSIDRVKIAAVVRAGANGVAKGSLRSKGEYDVAAVAQRLGGGGHRNASGVTLDMPLEEAERTIVEAMRECLGSS
ncbi:MAG: bifunctional oligoribonuclease/PAP phosphatase NrnA [Fimbriimonadaceae bacterium]|nr:bifunctional oligoribonuclease/PAP phosphatase NrnA [Fimbriimonadaceae bacterium]QYK57293.1 MAG: bifunctional oligoribonuclease/PAP phosphatase NrnA [Fimbriimonadaceae bacterium]